MSEVTLHKGTKLTEGKNIRRKRKLKLLMRYMYLTFEHDKRSKVNATQRRLMKLAGCRCVLFWY